jgi:hypothetical protein
MVAAGMGIEEGGLGAEERAKGYYLFETNRNRVVFLWWLVIGGSSEKSVSTTE